MTYNNYRRPDRNDRRWNNPSGKPEKLPDECFFDSFLKDGRLKEELFLPDGPAAKASRILTEKIINRNKYRQFLDRLRHARSDLKMKRIEFADARLVFLDCLTLAEEACNRNVVKSRQFVDMFTKHTKLVQSSKDEFFGFVQYFENIWRYMPKRSKR